MNATIKFISKLRRKRQTESILEAITRDKNFFLNKVVLLIRKIIKSLDERHISG